MKKIMNNRQFRIQLTVILCTTGLFFLILLISHLTMPSQIPSDYYADDGFYTVSDTSIQARVLLWLILLCAFELAAFFRSALADISRKIIENRKVWGKELLIAAVSGAVGALAAKAAFAAAGKEAKEYWILTAALLLIFFEIQIRLLLKRRPQGTAKERTGRYSLILFAAAAVLILLILFEWTESASRAPEYIRSWHFRFPFIVMIAETALACLLIHRYILTGEGRKETCEKAFIIVIFFLAVGYMLVLLPFVSPDEDAHYLSAYRLSDLLLGRICRFGDARLIMRTEDYLFFSGAELKNSAQYFAKITDQVRLFIKEPGLVVTEASMVSNAVPAYFPAAIGMTAARILHLSGTMLFCFARLGNIVFTAAVMSHVMKTVGEKRAAFFALMTLPMMLHLIGSCSYDAVIFCFCALFVSQFMRILSMTKEVSRREIRKLALFGVLMAPCKMVYLPLLLLVFLLPSERFGGRRKAAFQKTAIVCIALAGVVLITKGVTWMAATSVTQSLSASESSARILSWCQEEGYTLPILLSNFPNVILICVRTVIRAFDEYFFTMLGSRLGWLDTPIPLGPLVFGFILFLLAVQIREERTVILSAAKKTGISILCLLSAAAILLALTLSWTPLSYEIVAGVQGRYFLPLLIPLIWFPNGRLIKVEAGFRKFLLPAAVMVNIWILAYVYAHTVILG